MTTVEKRVGWEKMALMAACEASAHMHVHMGIHSCSSCYSWTSKVETLKRCLDTSSPSTLSDGRPQPSRKHIPACREQQNQLPCTFLRSCLALRRPARFFLLLSGVFGFSSFSQTMAAGAELTSGSSFSAWPSASPKLPLLFPPKVRGGPGGGRSCTGSDYGAPMIRFALMNAVRK